MYISAYIILYNAIKHNRSDKEKLVSNLMASGEGVGTKKKVLIEEVGGPKGNDSLDKQQQEEPPAPPPVQAKVMPVVPDEGPSLLEQMMAAQQQAKKKDDVVKAKVKAKEDKKALGGGFKKGSCPEDVRCISLPFFTDSIVI
jgi:hypothetical protein